LQSEKKRGDWKNLKKLHEILKPTPQRLVLVNIVLNCLIILCGIREILWPKRLPAKGGEIIRKRLFSFLKIQLRIAPERGRGAYLKKFIENALEVTQRYAGGLFHCFNDSRIPQTNNFIENLNGQIKRNLRKCSGRKSTASGPGSSCGRSYMFGVVLHACLPTNEINEMLTNVSQEDFKKAREILNQQRESEKKRRSYLRNPEKTLYNILEKWEEKKET